MEFTRLYSTSACTCRVVLITASDPIGPYHLLEDGATAFIRYPGVHEKFYGKDTNYFFAIVTEFAAFDCAGVKLLSSLLTWTVALCTTAWL